MKAIIQYIRDSREELRKVTWPTKQQTINSTILVVIVSIVIAAFLGGLDYGFNKLLEYVLLVF
jgi:preprotein translocase subunit SecE|tara:strand:- start:322 stop:510 length:189 start_codon:yes stop_codon:yes gene_type:complete